MKLGHFLTQQKQAHLGNKIEQEQKPKPTLREGEPTMVGEGFLKTRSLSPGEYVVK